MRDIERLIDNVLIEAFSIVQNLFLEAELSLEIVARFVKTPSAHKLIVERYCTDGVNDFEDEYYRSRVYDCMRLVKQVWSYLSVRKTYSSLFVLSKSLASVRFVNKIVSRRQKDLEEHETLRWYVRGLVLSDGAVTENCRLLYFHSSRPEILAIALSFTTQGSLLLTMFRKYKITGKVRPYIEVVCDDLFKVGKWIRNSSLEQPHTEQELSAFVAGLLDGDGSIDPVNRKVRLSVRPEPRNQISKFKSKIILEILKEKGLIDENSLNRKSLLKYDYINLRISDPYTYKILKNCINYMKVSSKRYKLERIMITNINIEQKSIKIRSLASEFGLSIKCRTKKYGHRTYRQPFIRGPTHVIQELAKKLTENSIEFYGPHRVDNYRSEISLPQSLSKYLCGDSI